MLILDLGTRTIRLAEVRDSRVLWIEQMEHKERNMRAGGVFDAAAVSEHLREIRKRREIPEKAGVVFAVAGAEIQTRHKDITLKNGPWSRDDWEETERKVLKIGRAFGPADAPVLLARTRYNLFVDDHPAASLSSLSGRRATYSCAAMLAPLSLIRRKMEAIQNGGFSPERITLEPLAVATLFRKQIPPGSVFALIDIGAGTSDIALASDTGILAVASVPLAGDSITEALARTFGLGFHEAETLKRNPGVSVRDIWGEERILSEEDLLAVEKEPIEALAAAIAEKIHDLLSRFHIPPLTGAVLVGGGALQKGVSTALASHLDISTDSLRVRSAETFGLDLETEIDGALLVTLLALCRNWHTFPTIRKIVLNNEPRLCIRETDRMTVEEIALAGGLTLEEFYGRPGEPIFLEDGTIVGGEPGGPPQVEINGVSATLETLVNNGDNVLIRRGVDGSNASQSASFAAVPSPADKSATIGSSSSPKGERQYSSPKDSETTKEKLARVKKEGRPDAERNISSSVSLSETSRIFRIDGEEVTAPREITETAPILLGELLSLPIERAIRVDLNGDPVRIPDRTRSAIVNGERRNEKEPLPENAIIETARPAWRLYEILPQWESKSGIRRIRINGNPGSFVSEIHEGDKVELE
ncbi:MAG: hypothetical protein D6679_11955 [Candidatus Hydrogenedentota bacterium]|nr:MAG: hypothetical protein D6679_11955 [Candidatus Hydrogenedentota bacterium]